MVKIVVMGSDSFSKMVFAEFEEGMRKGSFKKQEDVIYAESIDAARRMMTNERIRMLSMVKKEKPQSLYELAKLMKKNIKTVSTDASFLSEIGLLQLETYKNGARKKVRPKVSISKISVELAI